MEKKLREMLGIAPEEAVIVNRIFRLYLDGHRNTPLGVKDICADTK